MLWNFLSICAAVDVTLEYKLTNNHMHLTCVTNGWKLLPGSAYVNLPDALRMETNISKNFLTSNQFATTVLSVMKIVKKYREAGGLVKLWTDSSAWYMGYFWKHSETKIYANMLNKNDAMRAATDLFAWVWAAQKCIYEDELDNMSCDTNNTMAFDIENLKNLSRIPISTILYSTKERKYFTFYFMVSTKDNEVSQSVSTSEVLSITKDAPTMDLKLTVKKSTSEKPIFMKAVEKDFVEINQSETEGILGLQRVEIFQHDDCNYSPFLPFTVTKEELEEVQDLLVKKKMLDGLPVADSKRYFYDNRQLPLKYEFYEIVKAHIEKAKKGETAAKNAAARAKREQEIARAKEEQEAAEKKQVEDPEDHQKQPDGTTIPDPAAIAESPKEEPTFPTPDQKPDTTGQKPLVKDPLEGDIPSLPSKTVPVGQMEPSKPPKEPEAPKQEPAQEFPKEGAEYSKDTEDVESKATTILTWVLVGTGGLMVVVCLICLTYFAIKKRNPR